MEQSHTHSLTCSFMAVLMLQDRAEYLQQKPLFSPQRLKYLLYVSSQRRLSEPCSRVIFLFGKVLLVTNSQDSISPSQEAVTEYFRGYHFINTCQNFNFISFLLIKKQPKNFLRPVPFQYLPKMSFLFIVTHDNEP